VIWYIFLVAVLNVGAGFAVAVCAGRRYRELCVLAVEAAVPDVGFPAPGSQSQIPASPTVDSEDDRPHEEEPARPEDRVDEPADDSPDEAEDGGHAPGGTSADQSDPAEPSAADTESAAEEPPDGEALANVAPDEKREMSPGEACVQQFRSEVDKYHQELTRLDNAFRACADKPEAGEVQSQVDSLQEANEEYLASREEAHQTFQELHAEQEDFNAVSDELQAVLRGQDTLVEDTKSVIEGLDYEGDLAEGCRQMVQQTTKLLHANHELRDTLEEASVAVARHEGRLESIDEVKRNDPLTELSTRARLEACLADWWAKDPHRARQLHAAMIDVDQFGRLNERHGQEVGDRILRAIAQLLAAESRNHLLIARFAGQRFLLLFPDVDLRFATNLVERIRQTIEMARLEYRKEEIRVTVSCAVTEVACQDTAAKLYARAETTLREAKRYGRNRTFVHEGRYPTPVVPPNFTLKEKSVIV